MCSVVQAHMSRNIILTKIFSSLPDHVKKELQIMCVLFTEEIGGIFTLEFDQNGDLQFKTEALEADGRYDDIGGALRIKQLRQQKSELLESLELYYRVFSWEKILRLALRSRLHGAPLENRQC